MLQLRTFAAVFFTLVGGVHMFCFASSPLRPYQGVGIEVMSKDSTGLTQTMKCSTLLRRLLYILSGRSTGLL